jgi:ATP-dependent Clp protease ATP-binding subunit ClpC
MKLSGQQLKLSGQQRSDLKRAFMDAFPRRARLQDLMEFGLDVKLNTIVKENADLQDDVSDILDWAQTQGRLCELLVKSRQEKDGNPGNAELKQVITCIFHSNIAQPLPESPLTDTWRDDPLKRCVVASVALLRRLPSDDPDYAEVIGLSYWAGELLRRFPTNKTPLARSDIEIITKRLTELASPFANGFEEFLRSISNPARKFPDALVTNAPHPIAVFCHQFNRAETERERFDSLDALLNNTVKYLTAIALSQYWQDNPNKRQLRTWLGGLSQSRLLTSLTLLNQISTHYVAASNKSFIFPVLFEPYLSPLGHQSPVAVAYRFICQQSVGQQAEDDVITPQSFLACLSEYRQTTWEADPGQLDVDERKRLFPILREALDQLLQTFQPLLRYQLYYIEYLDRDGSDWVVTLTMFPGASGKAQSVNTPFRQRNRPESSLTLHRLYLCSPDQTYWLNLHPFLISHIHELYFLEQKEAGEDIWYVRCAPPTRIKRPANALTIMQQSLNGNAEDNLVEQFEHVNTELEKEENASRFHDMSFDILVNAYFSPEGRQALETALGEALRIGHFWLGVEFLLMALSRQDGSIFVELLQRIGLDAGDLRGMFRTLVGVATDKDWRQIVDVASLGRNALPAIQEANPATLAADFDVAGNHAPVISPRMKRILLRAAQLAHNGGEEQTQGIMRAGHIHLLLAALQHHRCLAVNVFLGLVRQAGWDPHEMIAWINQRADLTARPAPSDKLNPPVEPPLPRGQAVREPPVRPSQGKGVLGKLGRDLTALAQTGDLRPALGDSARQAMRQLGQILQQTQTNNPILLGDPGVGKTAIVEGFAHRLATDPKVINKLASRRIVELPLLALMAGTKYRGDLEERIQQVLAEVRAANGQTVLFIDEIHSILSGKSEGGMAAIADALKPALARGEFPCIGATTVAEYRRYIESDPALARRFTPVWIEEPSVEEAIAIVAHVARNHLGPQHGVLYPDEVIREAVILSARYIHDGYLPGKAIKLLDQAGPRMVMGGSLSGAPKTDEQSSAGPVSVETIRAIVSERTGVPLARLSENERQRLIHLEHTLHQRVAGQEEAVKQVAQVIKRAQAGLANPRRPLGVFLFAGPTGVGKTELALALAEALFGKEDAIERIDMSEFMEKHQVSRLIGSPPGYIGYQDEGQLTGRLRRRPYSVVLLDEIEKAHQDVPHLFLQLFDSGRLTDARGNRADGRNAIFIMTTNLGAKESMGFTEQLTTYQRKLQAAIEEHFSPEFLNRIDRIVYFNPLTEAHLLAIFDKLFARVAERFREQGIEVVVPESLKRSLCRTYTDKSYGARYLERAIEDEIVAPLTDKFLVGEIKPGQRVTLPEKPEPDSGSSDQVQRRGISPSDSAGNLRLPQLPFAAHLLGQKPQSKEAPSAVQPAIDESSQEAQNRATYDNLVRQFTAAMKARDIEITIDDEVIKLLCSPALANAREGKSTIEAFISFIEMPANKQFTDQRLLAGDKIRVWRNANQIEFKRIDEVDLS